MGDRNSLQVNTNLPFIYNSHIHKYYQGARRERVGEVHEALGEFRVRIGFLPSRKVVTVDYQGQSNK